MLLKDKVAIVYGGGGSVGGAVARALAREGAIVHLGGRTRASLDAVAKDITAKGGTAFAASVDAMNVEAVEAHLKAVVDRSGSSEAQYRAHARNFLDCIRSRKTPVSDVESGHRVAVACHLGNLSLRLGRSLRWDAKAEMVPGDAEAVRQLTRPYRAPWDKELKALGVSAG